MASPSSSRAASTPTARTLARSSRTWCSSESVAAQLAPLQREAELAELRALGDPAQVAPRIPDDLVDELTASGTAEQVVDSLGAIAETGVDTIAFVPIGPDPDEQLRLLADTILPELRG